MWGNLLSGIFGAILATLLSIFYFIISEQRKLRMEVLMDVVGFWDDIFDRFSTYHSSYGPVAEFLEKERHDAYRKVFGQLYSESLRAKLEFVYGKEHEAVRIFDELQKEFKIGAEVSVLFHIAKRENLKEDPNVVLLKFYQKVEPLRKSLRDILLQDGSASIIHQAIESGKKFFLKCRQP
jgi:hypothetical protein